MNTLSPHDLAWCVRRLPRGLAKIMMARGPSVFLAGGYIRARITGEDVNDIDLFAPSKEAARAVADSISENDPARLHITENAISIKGTRPLVQVIHRWTFEKPADVIASFDFTIACSILWYENGAWQSLCHPDYYADLAGRRLVYLSPVREEEAGGSMLRVLKFYQRGYRIPLDSLGAVIARLALAVKWETVNERDPEDREAFVAKVISGLLREVDPAVDPTHAAHLPSLKEQAEGELSF